MTSARLTAALCTVAWLLPAACGSTHEYAVQSERALGMDGTIVAEPVNGVSEVRINLAHLPPPQRFDGQYEAYVVWFTSDNGSPIMAGRLAYDEKERRGSLTATTPYEHVEVRITAEESTSVSAPSDMVVLKKRVTTR